MLSHHVWLKSRWLNLLVYSRVWRIDEMYSSLFFLSHFWTSTDQQLRKPMDQGITPQFNLTWQPLTKDHTHGIEWIFYLYSTPWVLRWNSPEVFGIYNERQTCKDRLFVYLVSRMWFMEWTSGRDITKPWETTELCSGVRHSNLDLACTCDSLFLFYGDAYTLNHTQIQLITTTRTTKLCFIYIWCYSHGLWNGYGTDNCYYCGSILSGAQLLHQAQ